MKVASKNLKKPKLAENSKSCHNSKELPKISKVAEQLVAKATCREPGLQVGGVGGGEGEIEKLQGDGGG